MVSTSIFSVDFKDNVNGLLEDDFVDKFEEMVESSFAFDPDKSNTGNHFFL